MPWEIVHRENEYCVIKQATNETVHCHPTKAKAMAHMRALYANTKDEKPEGDEAVGKKQKTLTVKAWNSVLSVLERMFEDLEKIASDASKK